MNNFPEPVPFPEDIGGENRVFGSGPSIGTGNILHTYDVTQVPGNVGRRIGDPKFHILGIFENTFPTVPNGGPALQKVPPGMDTLNLLGGIPDPSHPFDIQQLKCPIKCLVCFF